MRILVVSPCFIPAYDWGGPVKSTLNLTRGLSLAGAKVKVVTTNASQNGRIDVPAFRVEEGVEIITLPIVGGGRLKKANRFGFCHGLVGTLKKEIEWADIVNVHGLWGIMPPIAVALARLKRKPYIITPHGIFDKWPLGQKAIRKKIFLGLFGKRLLLGASGIHYTARMEKDQVPYWLAKVPSFIVPNSIEIRDLADSTGFKHEVGASDKEVLIGIFGRIHKIKGFDILIPALERACREYGANVRLVVAGSREGDYYREVEKNIEKHGIADRVVFLGMLTGDKLDRAYAGIDMLVVPSYHENFGMVVAEAAAQGTPSIVSEEVALCDWVREKETGLVLPLDVDAWARTIAGLTVDQIKKKWPGDVLRKLVIEEFSIKAVGEKMLLVYKTVLEQRKTDKKEKK